jgi:3-mercaptopyruvate sulfurtransferase SseA
VIELAPTEYRAKDPDLSIRAFRDEVLAAIGTKNLVDVRSTDEFSGKILAPAHLPQEQAQRPGHIPGALNVPWSRAANDDGTFKSDDDLTAIYAHAGLDGSAPTIAYCRIGEAHLTPGSCYTNFSGIPTLKTMTAAGPNTAPSSACPSSWEAAAPNQGL